MNKQANLTTPTKLSCDGPPSYSVTDADGGTWYPDNESLTEIESSDDPIQTAILICDQNPMCGVWQS